MDAMPIQDKQDSKYFSESRTDNAVRGELEGGYAHTRPRTTRAPLPIVTTGFSEISDADKNLLEAFLVRHGTFEAFEYTHPVTGDTLRVRLNAMPRFKYIGMGGLDLWSVTDVEMTAV